VAGVVLFTAAVTSAAMFANVAWVIPDANQAFREGVMAQFNPAAPAPRRGENELSLTELRQQLREALAGGRDQEAWRLETIYYRRWTLSATPLAIVGLIVALAFSRPWTRGRLTAVAGAVVFAAQYNLWTSSTIAGTGMVRPMVMEWAGPALCAAAAVLLICWRSPSRRPA
jgi:lipopolysaccharide export LptBFGC system permease protein LptF